MKVAITGGAGFIGSHIADELIKAHHEVIIIDNLTHGRVENIPEGAAFYEVDIRDKQIEEIFKKERPEVLIHEAAQIKVPNSVKDPIYDAEVNIIGSINLLQACVKAGVKKVIYPASAAIFGEPKYLPIDEEHPLNMISGYGVSKHTVEHYLAVYKALYNLDYVALRYSNVYGPRQDSTGEGGVVAIFSEQLLRGEIPTIFGDGKQIRDFVYVKDVAAANIAAINSNACGIYNVCTGEQVSVLDLLSTFNSLMNCDIKPNFAPPREGDILKSYMTYEKIKKELNWTPKFSLEQGLRETIAYYKSLE